MSMGPKESSKVSPNFLVTEYQDGRTSRSSFLQQQSLSPLSTVTLTSRSRSSTSLLSRATRNGSATPSSSCQQSVAGSVEGQEGGLVKGQGSLIPDSYSFQKGTMDEWAEKYGFIIGLLRKPDGILERRALEKKEGKLRRQLSASRRKRKFLSTSKNGTCNGTLTERSSTTARLVASKLEHLDLMCLTLERQIDVLSHVHRVIPSHNEMSVYSGEPDSLDGTTSTCTSELMDHEHHQILRSPQFTIRGQSSPLDSVKLLQLEKTAHDETRLELNALKKRFEVLRDEFDSGEGMSETTSLQFNNQLDEGSEPSTVEPTSKNGIQTYLTLSRDIPRLESSISEITKLHQMLVQLERVRDELTVQNQSLKTKLGELSSRLSENASNRLDKINNNHQLSVSGVQSSRSDLSGRSPTPGPNSGRSPTHGPNSGRSPTHGPNSGRSPTHGPNSGRSPTPGTETTFTVPSSMEVDEMKLTRKSTYKVSHVKDERGLLDEITQLRSWIMELQAKEAEATRQAAAQGAEVRALRTELKAERDGRNEAEHGVRVLEEQLECCGKRLEATEQCFLSRDEENAILKLDLETLQEENKRLRDELNRLHHHMEMEQCKGVERFSHFEKEITSILEENRNLREDATRERVLRKRYFNIVEELKGKIRVYCRIRPACRSDKLSSPGSCDHLVAKSSDPYTVTIETVKGPKEFQFDRVFLPEDSQELVFADTRNLLQSAFDGYNVCCVSYGQTGSGKSYTILGDEAHPGIAPRTFAEVFSLASDLSHNFDTKISFYILELYNDRLIDLLNPPTASTAAGNSFDSPDTNKLEIRRDRTGTVWVSGARVLVAESSGGLEKSFRQALTGRHTASTKMNDRSSRSHLIIGIVVETTSRTNGTILRGKISLLDLAGSERTGKSGVSAETLREANAINKSLSALGDVISALNTDQNFIPYRNNKLTLLMQDSIGGNAKTLMFVNISPLASNVDETLVSLVYAARVKQVTNGAIRNTDSKEIARLRHIISRLKRGEPCSVEEDTL